MNDAVLVKNTAPEAESSTFQWPVVGRPGIVPVDSLYPDPNQPRWQIKELELKILAATIKEGGQREILTVRELTAAERASGNFPPNVRYEVVSGHRRLEATKLAGIPTIEIRVKNYSSRAEQELDAWLLNEARVGLTDIENAVQVARLAKMHGWETQEEIGRKLGKNQFWVSSHLALLKLCPEAQDRMHPRIVEKDRLKMGAATFLARFDQNLQRDLITRMPDNLRTVGRQVSWMREELIKLGIPIPTRTRRPSKLRERLGNFSEVVQRNTEALLTAGGLEALFENSPPEQVEVLLKRLGTSLGRLEELVKRIQTLSKKGVAEEIRHEPSPYPPREKEKTSPPQTAEEKKVVGAAQPAPRSAVPSFKPTPLTSSASQRREVKTAGAQPPVKPGVVMTRQEAATRLASRNGSAMTTAPTPPPKTAYGGGKSYASGRGGGIVPAQRPTAGVPGGEEITTEYWDGRMVLGKISLERYVQLWDRGELKFQHEKKPKPTSLPTREEALVQIQARSGRSS